MLKDLFIKRQYATVKPAALKKTESEEKPNIPSGMWTKCEKCNGIIYYEDLENSKYVCTSCGHHFRINAKKRIEMLFEIVREKGLETAPFYKQLSKEFPGAKFIALTSQRPSVLEKFRKSVRT